MNIAVCDRCGKTLDGYIVGIRVKKQKHLNFWNVAIDVELCPDCHHDFNLWMLSKENPYKEE